MTLGREGGGPGELRGPDGVYWVGETILVSDSDLRRLTAYAASSGRLLSVATVPEQGVIPLEAPARLADRSFVQTWMASNGIDVGRREPERIGTVVRGEARIVRFARDGSVLDVRTGVVLGVERDDLDVERARAYRLRRG